MLDFHNYVSIHHIYSISVLTCQQSARVNNVVKAVQHVIKKAKTTGRRSVLAVPLATLRSNATLQMNTVVEEAVKENIVVVTSAGKEANETDILITSD